MAFVVGPDKISLNESRAIKAKYDNVYLMKIQGDPVTPNAQTPDDYVRGALYRHSPATDAMMMEVTGYYGLTVGGVPQPYTIRTSLNGTYFAGSDWKVRKVAYAATMTQGQGGLFCTEVYPNPASSTSKSWSVEGKYKDFSVTFNYSTSSNSYTNSGYSFSMDLAGNWTVDSFTWAGSNSNKGNAMTMRLQMVQGSTAGTVYTGTVTKADIYLEAYPGLWYWVQTGSIPFRITAL